MLLRSRPEIVFPKLPCAGLCKGVRSSRVKEWPDGLVTQSRNPFLLGRSGVNR